ncbi:MAG: Methyltransferase type 11 [Bacteroidetes bacterium]|jgi:cyclopropane fatty-acyl-phospholipid synthase-like methyltransferase|nr:Methyltransferase type 11 [Bacteroidota bacterium]
MEKNCWFEDWFNSPYYHLLYNKRDDREADHFISNLCQYLNLPPSATIWDIACGRGRHTNAFARKGFHVTGTDLSANSINEALKTRESNAEFLVHDMLKPFDNREFDCAVNLFTSIGYFEKYEDNFLVFENVHKALKAAGVFVVDFFNANKIKDLVNTEYVEQRGDITFYISKRITENRVIKKINFEHSGKNYTFEETVSLFQKSDFEKFAAKQNFKLENTFGDYELNGFDSVNSDRLILIFRK